MNLKATILAAGALIATAALAYAPSVTITASAPAKAVAGKSMTVSVKISIPHGYHIYGPGKIKTGIPTEVSLVAPKGFKVGSTTYPPTKKFDALGETVDVFSGEATVKVTVVAPKNAHGKQNFTIKVASQACNDRTCLIPSTAEAKFSVTFR